MASQVDTLELCGRRVAQVRRCRGFHRHRVRRLARRSPVHEQAVQ